MGGAVCGIVESREINIGCSKAAEAECAWCTHVYTFMYMCDNIAAQQYDVSMYMRTATGNYLLVTCMGTCFGS